jgi:hypothetical protein
MPAEPLTRGEFVFITNRNPGKARLCKSSVPSGLFLSSARRLLKLLAISGQIYTTATDYDMIK